MYHKNQPNDAKCRYSKYTSPMDGMGVSFFYNKYLGCVFFGYFVRIGIPGDSSPYRFFSKHLKQIQDISRKFLAETNAFSRKGLAAWASDDFGVGECLGGSFGARGLGGWWSTYSKLTRVLGPQKGS